MICLILGTSWNFVWNPNEMLLLLFFAWVCLKRTLKQARIKIFVIEFGTLKFLNFIYNIAATSNKENMNFLGNKLVHRTKCNYRLKQNKQAGRRKEKIKWLIRLSNTVWWVLFSWLRRILCSSLSFGPGFHRSTTWPTYHLLSLYFP